MLNLKGMGLLSWYSVREIYPKSFLDINRWWSHARLAWGTICRSLITSSWAVLLPTSRQSGLSSTCGTKLGRVGCVWTWISNFVQVGSTCRDGLIGASNVDIQNVHRMIYCFTSCNIATVLSLKVTACLMYFGSVRGWRKTCFTTKVCADLALIERPGEYLSHYVSANNELKQLAPKAHKKSGPSLPDSWDSCWKTTTRPQAPCRRWETLPAAQVLRHPLGSTKPRKCRSRAENLFEFGWIWWRATLDFHRGFHMSYVETKWSQHATFVQL